MREGSAAPDMGEFAGGSERRELLGGHGRSLLTSENVSRGEGVCPGLVSMELVQANCVFLWGQGLVWPLPEVGRAWPPPHIGTSQNHRRCWGAPSGLGVRTAAGVEPRAWGRVPTACLSSCGQHTSPTATTPAAGRSEGRGQGRPLRMAGGRQRVQAGVHTQHDLVSPVCGLCPECHLTAHLWPRPDSPQGCVAAIRPGSS